MSASITLDHLAIGVRDWADGFRRFASELGGRWSHGGDAGQFAPCQLLYPGGIAVELIAPGGAPDGFMHRFIARSGPGPHHITFRVTSLDAALTEVSALGIDILDAGLDLPFRREAFLHPKKCGLGTLLQLVQFDDEEERAAHRSPVPASFPAGPGEAPPRSVAWTGITAESLGHARELLAGALGGAVTEDGPGWLRVSWGPGRDLLVRSGAATPGGAALWAGPALGVAHVVFASGPLAVGDLESGAVPAEPMPADEATGITVWLAAGAGLGTP
jgi:methylmalonyl-CoA/ethylmalonyl-CoA epimerase